MFIKKIRTNIIFNEKYTIKALLEKIIYTQTERPVEKSLNFMIFSYLNSANIL